MKNSNKILVLFGIILGVFIIGLGIFNLITGGVMIIDVVDQHLSWKESTTPLEVEVVDDLCKIFELELSDPRCDQIGEHVYGPDFFPEVYDKFTPRNKPWATFQRVEELIGKYQYECEPTVKQADGLEYYVCVYDFAGDRVFPVAIFFYTDGRIMRLIADVTD